MPGTAPTLVRIDTLAHGGEALGALPSGKRVFVPLAAPGDLLEVEVIQEKAQFARGRLVRVVEPGATRRAPRCRHATRCGGCQLQQVADAAQLGAKEEAFYSSLQRLGGVPRDAIPDARPIAPSPAVFGYRARCRLRVSGAALGFCGWRSSAVVPLEECPVLAPPLERLVLALGAALAARPVTGVRDVHACVGDGDAGAAALLVEGAPGAAAAGAGALLGGVPGLAGVVVIGSRGAPLLLGDPVLSVPAPHAPGARLLLRPDLFAQANPAQNARLVGAVVDLLAPGEGDAVLDLYAGAGNFSFALAQRCARLVAVEESRDSLALARRAAGDAGDAGLRGRVHLVAGDAVAACADLAGAGERIDLALMDPPRVGAKEAPAALARLGPRRIAYVSCDPATLARDVRAFTGLGYRVAAAAPFDMFPQTYHVEGVVLLERP